MKRDLDLVREILFVMEKSSDSYYSINSLPKIDGYSEQTILYHMRIMTEANLLTQDKGTDVHETVINHQVIKNKRYYEYYSLSWQGHEFLSALRDDKQWKNIKDVMQKAGGFLLDTAMMIAKKYIETKAMSLLS